jgi:hypothetical protein
MKISPHSCIPDRVGLGFQIGGSKQHYYNYVQKLIRAAKLPNAITRQSNR